ncbi:MAG: ROK family protein [Chloroflexi bacterium]|nr:ROK family protein [Chloroflexota bacterium]
MNKYIVGVDLGGTRIRACLADERGTILARANRLTLAQEGQDAVLRRIVEAVREAIGEHKASDLAGVGIGAPGPLDPKTGVIFTPPNLPGWHNVPLKALLEEALGLPVYAGNDANLAALGEHRFGAGQGVDDLIYITVSTGIGGGVIAAGKLLVGADGAAGEVGHHTIDLHGPRCNCGNVGCLEVLAAGPAIAGYAIAAIQSGEETLMATLAREAGDVVTAAHVTRAAHAGDVVARRIMRQVGEYIGVGVVNLLHLFNPRLVIIGGGVAMGAGELLFGPIREMVQERAMEIYRPTRIVPAGLGDDVGLLGAVALVLTERAAQG